MESPRVGNFVWTAAVIFLLVVTANTQSVKDIPAIAHSAGESVVTVVIRDQNGKELGSGSGFVASVNGKVVTNNHVIKIRGASQAEVRFSDGSSFQVEGVLATDADRDLAVLKLKAGRQFPALPLANSSQTQVGEHVVAIGSPLAGMSTVSTEFTVSDGILSGIREWPGHNSTVFQITDPISPGSSGGALLNMSGEVVGVTFAQITEGQNLNFAIPVDYVRPLLGSDYVRPLAQNVIPPKPESGPEGSYTGFWQSARFSVSGAATMTVRMVGNAVTADIFLTGGEVTTATLTGAAVKSGEGIWTAELTSKHPKLNVRAIFRNGAFVGDYRYSRFMMDDRGQWSLRKE